MSEYSDKLGKLAKDIEMFHEELGLFNKKDFRLYMTLQPNETQRTGCGIIVKVEDNPWKDKVDFECGDKLYTVLTDFGNVMKLTDSEIHSAYDSVRIETDPQGRYNRQMDLLVEASEWFKGE